MLLTLSTNTKNKQASSVGDLLNHAVDFPPHARPTSHQHRRDPQSDLLRDPLARRPNHRPRVRAPLPMHERTRSWRAHRRGCRIVHHGWGCSADLSPVVVAVVVVMVLDLLLAAGDHFHLLAAGDRNYVHFYFHLRRNYALDFDLDRTAFALSWRGTR